MELKKERRLKLSEYPEIMDIKDVCEYLNVSRVTAYRFLEKNDIKYMFVGREYRVSRDSLAEHLGVK
jgi:excisionase family DNA binding protein